jgi:chromosome segregation ATPase
VDSNKSRIRAFTKQIAAQAALRKVQEDHQEKKQESQQVEDDLQRLMQELRRQEAKQAELNRQAETKHVEISRHESRAKSHKEQIENLEKVAIPKLERKIADADADIERLDDEMATALQHSLADDERSKLAELKESIERFVEKIETQQQKVDRCRHEKQKLEGLLENNLLKRKAEIQESSELFNDNERRQSFRRLSTAQVRDQQKSELAERKLERDSAARHKAEVSGQLDEARKSESEIKKELMALAKRLDDLQAEDMKNVKAWEDSEHQSERFLTKVCIKTARSVCL